MVAKATGSLEKSMAAGFYSHRSSRYHAQYDSYHGQR